MTDHEDTTPVPDFKDCKTGLLLFGSFEIISGAFCALLAPLMIVAMILSSTLHKSSASPMSAGTMIPGMLFYALLAVWFIWMGIGSIKARRWARALLLVSSWIWLIGGTNGLIWMLFFMPDIYGQMAERGQAPQEMMIFIKYIMFGFMTVFYVLVPGVLVIFYGNKNVKATCEFRDPQIRWTDKCPLPVLAVSLLFGCWTVSLPLVGFYGWVIPFFGMILSGTAGALAALVIMLLSAYIAWGTYKLKLKAWRCAISLTIAWALSAIITFSRVGMWEFYEKMNLSEKHLEMMKQVATMQEPTIALLTGVWGLGGLAFLLYTKRYFNPPSQQESAPQKTEI